MQIIADTSRCIGSATCVLTDPSVFDQSENYGTVIVRTENVDGEHLDRVRQAVKLCPSGALSLDVTR
jgi:ferredoxin